MAAGAADAASDLGFEHVLVPGGGGGTLLLLHATGGDEHQLVELGRRLAPRATLLSPRGKVLEGGVARRFFSRRGALDLDIPDLLARTDELGDFIAATTARHGLDAGGVVALGYSNGANMAVSLLLRRPETLAGAALLRPTLPYEPDAPPRLDGKRVLVLGGTRDPYAPRERLERLVALLREGSAEVTATLRPAGHELTPEDIAETGGWLETRTPAGWW